jgi:hypothetical protein
MEDEQDRVHDQAPRTTMAKGDGYAFSPQQVAPDLRNLMALLESSITPIVSRSQSARFHRLPYLLPYPRRHHILKLTIDLLYYGSPPNTGINRGINFSRPAIPLYLCDG